MINTTCKFLSGISIFVGSWFISRFAMAATIGDAANNITGSVGSLGKLVQSGLQLAGLCFIGIGVFTFVKHSRTDGQQGKISTAVILILGGAILFYIGSIIQTGGDTVWGSGGGDRSIVKIGQ